jgi:hypothetical protein
MVKNSHHGTHHGGGLKGLQADIKIECSSLIEAARKGASCLPASFSKAHLASTNGETAAGQQQHEDRTAPHLSSETFAEASSTMKDLAAALSSSLKVLAPLLDPSSSASASYSAQIKGEHQQVQAGKMGGGSNIASEAAATSFSKEAHEGDLCRLMAKSMRHASLLDEHARKDSRQESAKAPNAPLLAVMTLKVNHNYIRSILMPGNPLIYCFPSPWQLLGAALGGFGHIDEEEIDIAKLMQQQKQNPAALAHMRLMMDLTQSGVWGAAVGLLHSCQANLSIDAGELMPPLHSKMPDTLTHLLLAPLFSSPCSHDMVQNQQSHRDSALAGEGEREKQDGHSFKP